MNHNLEQNKTVGITLPDFKTHHKTTGINTSKYNIPLIVDKHPTFAANVLKSIEEKYIDEKDINTIE